VIIVKAAIVEQQVDALIKGGYYSNREEFVEDAIRTFFELRKEMKIAAVVEIYKKEELSISKAAELAGLNIEEMKRVLADKGIEIKRGFTRNRKIAASEFSGMMR
jgi:predicted HTH domain antitoxin